MNIELGKQIGTTQMKKMGINILRPYKSQYTICIKNDDEPAVLALDKQGTVVGLFNFREWDEEGDIHRQLTHMNVMDLHQKKGIGKELMREAVQQYGSFDLPSIDTSQQYYYHDMGLGFAIWCYDNNILPKDRFRYPTEY